MLVVVTAATVIGFAFFMFYKNASFSSRTGSDSPLYSVRRHDPYGTAAFSELLQERGNLVQNLERPRLDREDRGVLIQVIEAPVASSAEKLPPLHIQRLADWIAEGNVVIQFSRFPTELMQYFKIVADGDATRESVKQLQQFEAEGHSPRDTPAAIVRAPLRSSRADDVSSQLLLWSPMRLKEPNDPRWSTLATLPGPKHDLVAGEYRVGKGRLVIVGAPTPILNATIMDEGNLDFLMRIIGDQPVWFDEWSHGIGHEPTIIGFLHDAGLMPVLIQLAFLAGLYVWSTSGFVGLDVSEPALRRSSIEQISTLGFLYSRSFGPQVTIDRVTREVQRRLCDSFGCDLPGLSAKVAALRPELRQKVDRIAQIIGRPPVVQDVRCPACGNDLAIICPRRVL